MHIMSCLTKGKASSIMNRISEKSISELTQNFCFGKLNSDSSAYGKPDTTAEKLICHYINALNTRLLQSAKNHKPTLKNEMENVYHILIEEKENLRAIHQILSSSAYSQQQKICISECYKKLLNHSEVLASEYKVQNKKLEPLFLILLSAVQSFCLVDDNKTLNQKLDYIYKKSEEL